MNVDKLHAAIDQLSDQVSETTRTETIEDVIDTLKRFLVDAPQVERPGLQAAIEIVQSNY